MLQRATHDPRNFLRWPFAIPVAAALALLCVPGAPAGDARAETGSGAAAGTLRARYSEFDLLLLPAQTSQGQTGRVVRAESRDGTASVAPGSYHLLEWRVHAQDAAGRHWRAQGNAWPDPILVPAGGDVQLPLAFPLRAYLSSLENNGQLRFHLEYAGPFGERCGLVTVDELPPLPPSLRILDERGRLLTRLRFDSQHGGSYHAAWKVPAGLSGRFCAVPEPNLGPLRVDVGSGLNFELRASRMVRVPPRVGQLAPDFNLPTHSGQTVQLGFLRPRPVILCFFCNCGLCRAVATELAGASELRDPASPDAQAQVVVAASDTNVLEEGFRRETGLAALYLNDSPPMVAPQYGSEACPRCWLIDEQGMVRYVNVDRQMPAKELVTQLRSALAAPRPRLKPQDWQATVALSALRPTSPPSIGSGPSASPSARSRPGKGSQRVAATPDLLPGNGRRVGRLSSPAVAGDLRRQAGPDRSAGSWRGAPRGAAPAPTSGGRGTVATDVQSFGLTLIGSGPSITIEGHDGRAPLAADTYDVLNWWAERRDAEGHLWRVRGGARAAAFTVGRGATARLCLVSPLQAQFTAMNRPGEVQFYVYLESSSLGRCSSVTVDGRDAPRPHIEVRDVTGAVIADLECSYCCGFKASARWRPPTDARGPFTAVPKIEFGPLKVVADPPRLTVEAGRQEDAASNPRPAGSEANASP